MSLLPVGIIAPFLYRTAWEHQHQELIELYKSIRPGDIIARYGGDEFVAHFRCNEKTLLRRAEHLRQSVENTSFIWKGNKIHVTLSIGILSQKYDTSVSIDELMSVADHAMYRSKKSGRNKVSKYH